MKSNYIASCLLLSLVCCPFVSLAKERKSVSGTEVTGVFRCRFSGEFRGSYNEIKVLALGNNQLKVSFDLLHPQKVNGQFSANMGRIRGLGSINGDTGIFKAPNKNKSIVLKFVSPGKLKVTQNGSDSDFGFGLNVSASGDYEKVSSEPPTFPEDD